MPLFPQDLAQHRKLKGISLSQVGEATKISRRYLEAIEWGDFGKLPGGIYGLNYVRQYARAVHCDEDRLVACYRAAAPPLDTELEIPSPPPSRARWLRDLILPAR